MPVDLALEKRVQQHRAGGDIESAADALVRGYGPEIHSFLASKLNDESRAGEAFSLFSEDVWRGLSAFRGDASLRTWAYCIARRAAGRIQRGDRIREGRFAVGDTAAERAASHVRTTTAIFKRTDVKNHVRALREQLTDEEQELLTLRVDRAMDWREIARVQLEDEPTPEELTKHAALLRKRFERAKEHLRQLAESAGLLSE